MTDYSDHEDDSLVEDPDFCWYCTCKLDTYTESVRGVCDECFKAYNESRAD
jgi:hypothetical protein